MLAGDKFQIFSGQRITHNMNYSPSKKVYLGCLKPLSDLVDPLTTPKISIAHAVMWIWPIRLRELFPSEIGKTGLGHNLIP